VSPKIKEYSDLRCLSSLVRRHFRTLIPFLTIPRTYNILNCMAEMMVAATRCRSRPFIYRVDPCTLCNLKCACCAARGFRTSEKRMMALDDFVHIIDAVERYAIRISLYDEGEPLMNKDLYQMVTYATEKKMARPGNLWVELGSSLALSEEAVEFAASGVEGALLLF